MAQEAVRGTATRAKGDTALDASRGTARRKPVVQGIRVGSVGGVQISLDYSWFVLFFLIFGTFTGVVFPDYVPGLARPAYVLMGIVGTLLFFASLLAHELAHAFVAMWKDIEVEGITLFIFGGMARTKSEPARPVDEFLIAGVGPLMSLALAAGFYWLAIAADANGWHPAIFGVAGHMAFLNLALAVFNVLPGFPLDGGRMLRSVVWQITGSLRRATRVATLAGKGLGWLIVAAGAWAVLIAGQLVSGLWFIFIGWFLANAADTTYQQVLLRHVLEGRTAADAMTHFPETVEPDVTLEKLVNEYFMKRPYNAFPVTEDGIVIGLITLSHVKQVDRSAWKMRTVADVMTPMVDTLIVAPGSPMTDVVERMSENETRRVVVADEWELRGIITGGDVANWLDRAGLMTGRS
ncbi:MAG: site-2 protease family protein [Gemmatimonadetes bacterium]|nr:site-2 protease family protein [Gemmatimonadota bacterium]